ncbi:GumC family protein [Granulicella mallensis]|uniref:non-specific protein-tyrosine kinase n=1 Tax=Granulicella mallensis (strain ATCC BAA-1857 / DSM 23137 / MP5ACTX8) TaxID=682795 RepID=G8NS05_GRAMM|nr:polysaccharide biosynthesis tyrosine autokinase [Granulicella mallensis]AEU36213.1 capsular exopolysaccharide family [Granulicella mallensis MP5ACTX8]
MIPSRPENFSAEPDSRAASAGPAATDATLSEALMTIRKRKYVILAAALLGMIYGFYKGSTQPHLFESYGDIEIRSGSSDQYRIAGSTGAGGNRLPTEVAILKSDTLLLTVAEDLDLANNQDFLGMTQRPPHVNIEDPNVRQATIGRMQAIVSVANIPKTDIIRISCSTFNAKLSADIINKLIDAYIKRSFTSRVSSTQRASGWLTSQLDELKHQVETSQNQVIDLQKRIGVLSIDPTHNQISSSLEELTTAAGTAQIARILAESRYRVLSGMDPNSLDQTVANTTNNVAATQLATLRSQRETDMANYAKLTAPGNLGPNHPQVKAAHAQIEELDKAIKQEQDRVIAQAKQTFIAAQANEQQTRAALEDQKSEAYKLRDDLVQYTLLQRDFESNRTLYEGLLEKLQTARVQAGLDSTEIDIIDQAVPPAQPSLKSKSSIMMLNTIIGIVLGAILGFILESLDTNLHSVAEIEAVSGLHSLALIPRARRTGIDTSNLSVIQRNLATLSSPKSQFTEAFRGLRTSLLLSTAGKLPKVILLTSATPSEGKTTVSTNLACVFAQRDVRVLLIDADLRRPTVHHRLGLNGKVGLTSVLTGSHTLEQAIQNVPEMPSLDILVSGPVPPFPTEMLSSETMAELLEKCRGIYTHILIDSPPLLSVTDGIILGRDADAVVLIVRHGKSNKHTIRRARDLLLRAGVHITGIALNAIDLNSPEYYGYYGYSGYSGYGSAGMDAAGWESQSGKSTGKGQK